MSVKSVLDDIGQDAKKLFAWLGSPGGQALVGAGEAVVEAEFPAATGIINLGNQWLTEIFKEQTLATAAGAQSGSNSQKATAVITAVTPGVLQFVQKMGYANPTQAQLAAANAALVAFANVFGPAPAAPPAA